MLGKMTQLTGCTAMIRFLLQPLRALPPTLMYCLPPRLKSLNSFITVWNLSRDVFKKIWLVDLSVYRPVPCVQGRIFGRYAHLRLAANILIRRRYILPTAEFEATPPNFLHSSFRAMVLRHGVPASLRSVESDSSETRSTLSSKFGGWMNAHLLSQHETERNLFVKRLAAFEPGTGTAEVKARRRVVRPCCTMSWSLLVLGILSPCVSFCPSPCRPVLHPAALCLSPCRPLCDRCCRPRCCRPVHLPIS